MKYIKTIHLLTATALAFAASQASADPLPKHHFKVVGAWTNLSQYKELEQPFWTKIITEKSNGSITADIKGVNEMGLKGPEVGRLLNLGVLDFGTSVLGYMAADNSKNEAIDLAGLSPDIATARQVTNAYRPVLEKLYKEKYNVKLLGMFTYPAQVLYCKAPITGLSDLKGKKVRTGNRSLAEFVGALGGTGVTLAFSETVPALQAGVVDCAVTGTLSGYSAKWSEVSNYIYDLPVGWSQAMHGVNYAKWDKLDAPTQDLLIKEIKNLEDRVWEAAEQETAAGIACNTGIGACSYGPPAKMQLVKVSDADRALLHKTLEEVVIKKWSDRCGPECSKEFNDTIGKVVAVKAK